MGDYNGWTNRSTWSVVLRFGNDEHLYRLICDRHDWTRDEAMRLVWSIWPDGSTPETRTDLEEVNWNEVIEAWNEE